MEVHYRTSHASRLKRKAFAFDRLPEIVPQCSSVNLTWYGGEPPFTLRGARWQGERRAGVDSVIRWTIASNLDERQFDWTAVVSDNVNIEITCEDSSFSSELHSPTLLAAPAMHFKIAKSAASDGGACLDEIHTSLKTGLKLQQRQYTSNASSSYGPPWLGVSSSLTNTSAQQGMVAGMSTAIGVLFLGFLVVLWLYVRLRIKVKTANTVQKTLSAWKECKNQCSIGGSAAENTQGESPTMREPPSRSMYTKLFGHTASKPIEHAPVDYANYLHIFKQLSEGSSTNSTAASGPHPNLEGLPRSLFPEMTSTPSSVPVIHTASQQRQVDEESEVVIPPPPVHDPNLQRKILAWESTFVPPERHLSVAPSEHASTVGGFSTISDEHYHRSKASTISPACTMSPASSRNVGKRNLLRPKSAVAISSI